MYLSEFFSTGVHVIGRRQAPERSVRVAARSAPLIWLAGTVPGPYPVGSSSRRTLGLWQDQRGPVGRRADTYLPVGIPVAFGGMPVL